MKSFILLLAVTLCSLMAFAHQDTTSSAGDVAGKWHFVLQTQDGDRTFDPVFTLDGDKVGGKWDKDDVKGSFAAGKLNLEFEANSEEAGKGILKITGQLQKDQITGDWTFQTYEGKFVAKRLK